MSSLPMPEPAPGCPPWCDRVHWTGGWDRTVSATALYVEKVCLGEAVRVATDDQEITVRLRRFAVVDEGPNDRWDPMFVDDTQISVRTSTGDAPVLMSLAQADELASALRRLGDQVPPS